MRKQLSDAAAEFYKDLGLKIKQERIVRGISRQKMAEKLGVTQQQLQKYESGQNRVCAFRLFTICQFFGISGHDGISRFFSGQSDMESTDACRGEMEIMRKMAKMDKRSRRAILDLAGILASRRVAEEIMVSMGE